MQYTTGLITLVALASTSMALVTNTTAADNATSIITGATTSSATAYTNSTTAEVNDESTTTLTDLIVVTELTTYCPEPTEFVTNGKTYTVTQATTLTITDCPCTIKKPTKPATTTTVEEVTTKLTTFCPESTEIVIISCNETSSVTHANVSSSMDQTTTVTIQMTQISTKASAPVVQLNQNDGNAVAPSLSGFVAIAAMLLL